MPHKAVQIVHERIGIVDTREPRERFLIAAEAIYKDYKSKAAKASARRAALEFAIAKALNPMSPLEIDWSTNSVFISEDGWTRQIARFNTEQYQTVKETV